MVNKVFQNKLGISFSKYERFTPDQLVKSQWQKEKYVSPAYLIYRWLMAIIFFLICLSSFLEIGRPNKYGVKYYKWPIYLTNWGLVLCTVQAIFGAILVTKFYNKAKKCPDGAVEVVMTKSLNMYWVLNSSALVIALGITCVYWFTIYNPEIHDLDPINILAHGFNSVLMIVEFMMVAHPVRLLHFIFPICFTLIYAVFNLFYFLIGGTDRHGLTYIYKSLDWRSPVQSIVFCLGGLSFLLFLHVLVWFFVLLKRYLHFYIKKRSVERNYDIENDNERQENLEQPFRSALAVV